MSSTMAGNADHGAVFRGFSTGFDKRKSDVIIIWRMKNDIIIGNSLKENRQNYDVISEKGEFMGNDIERYPLRASHEVMEEARQTMEKCGIKSMNIFIENAIRFYTGYLTAEDHTSYLPNLFLSGMKSIVAESDHQQNRMYFKVAVELSMINRILAAYNRITDEDFLLLRQACLEDVRKINGTVTLGAARDELIDEE